MKPGTVDRLAGPGPPRIDSGRHAPGAVAALKAACGAKFPKAVAKTTDDLDQLLAFYHYPPGTGPTCGPPTRSSQPSPWSGSPTKIARGPGLTGRRAGHGVQAHRVSPGSLPRRERTHLVGPVRVGTTFINGKLPGRPGEGKPWPEAA